MKLYTEEQVRKELNSYKIVVAEEIISQLTPIELPSDEEIKEHFSWGYGGDSGSAIYGAKWLKEQILNQNK